MRVLVLSLLILQIVCSGFAWAQTRYVTDVLEVTLRTGETTRHRVIRMLPSGTPVTVLDVDATTGYARVRLEDGTVGFVLEHQLQEEPVARARLAELEARLADLQADPDALSARLAALQSEQMRMRHDFDVLEREKRQAEQDLATLRRASANILDITNDRERLRIQVSELMRERAMLEQANRDLTNRDQQRWFLIGAGVTLIGILIGLLLPHLRVHRRRGSWGSL
nr:TIGR04211 family SH3 domain-containing protein [Thiocapsa imhoffii]